MIKKVPILLIVILFCSCASNSVLKGFSAQQPAKVTLGLKLTNQSQIIFAQPLEKQLVEKLNLYSQNLKDFVLSKDSATQDFKLILKIIDLELVPLDEQNAQYLDRKAIEYKYDKINDSITESYKPISGGKIAAANIAINVAANALLLPFGIMSVTMIEDNGPQYARPSDTEKRIIESTYSTAFVKFKASLISRNGEIVWAKDPTMTYQLIDVTKQSEQLKLLVRNTILSIEDDLPLLTPRKRRW